MSMVGDSGVDRGHIITMTLIPTVDCQAPLLLPPTFGLARFSHPLHRHPDPGPITSWSRA